MEIKGTAVKATPQYIRKKHPDALSEWMDNLPKTSYDIINHTIWANKWYPLVDSVIYPTITAGQMFFHGNIQQASWEIGRFSALESLSGIYKAFIRIAKPGFLLNQYRSIFSAYYRGADISYQKHAEREYSFLIGTFKKEEEPVVFRIAGWMQGALELTRSDNIDIRVKRVAGLKPGSFLLFVRWE